MPNYRIVPIEGPGQLDEISAVVPSAALDLARQRGVTKADVYDGDRYVLSLRRDGPINACWLIVAEPGWKVEAD